MIKNNGGVFGRNPTFNNVEVEGDLTVDGSIIGTVVAAAGTLTGATLAANVIDSSLTSVGTLEFLTVTNTITGSINGTAATATSANSALTANTATTATTATTAGTVTTAAQPAITSVGTMTAVNTSGVITGTNTTASTSSTTGAVIVAGGVGIAKDSFINGHKVGVGLLADQKNLAIGYNTLNSTISGGIDNVALGYVAGQNITSGPNNVMLGSNAGFSNTTGQSNMCIGNGAHYSNQTGSYNVAIGGGAGHDQNNNSVYNVFLGTNSGYWMTSGNNTVAIGGLAGVSHANGSTNLTASSDSVYIGYNTRGFNNSDSNSVVIGANAIGIGANKSVIGNSSTTETKLFGQLTLDATACISAASATALALKTVVPAGTGVTPTIQVICPSSATALTSSAIVQNVFSPIGFDTITVQASTTYMFDGVYIIKTTGAISHIISMSFALTTATITNCSWTTIAYALSTPLPVIPTRSQDANFFAAVAGGNVNTSNSTTYNVVKFEGIMRVNAAGSVVPQITFSAAPTGTNTLEIGSYLRFYPIGSNTIDSVGTAIG